MKTLKQIKFLYKPSELKGFIKRALKSFALGLGRMIWSVILILVNVCGWLVIAAKNAIRKHPCLSVGITFLAMSGVAAVIHIQLKTKLTTAEWQRDSLEQRLDSIKVLSSNNTRYFKYQEYKTDKE